MRNDESVSNAQDFTRPSVIVMATDLTDISSLLPHAIAQARACRASLVIVHAIAPNQGFSTDVGTVPYLDPMEMERDLGLEMEAVGRDVRDAGIACTTLVREGFPADVVAEAVRETGAGRVIVSTHGRRGIKRLVLGSVAHSIVATSAVPVCTVGPHCEVPGAGVRAILHPTGLGRACGINARLALNLAEFYGSNLTLMHVLDRKADIEHPLEAQRASHKLDSLRFLHPGVPWTSVRTRIALGDRTAEILRNADEIHAELIVIGVQTEISFWRGESGKTAYAIVVSAKCPVLSFRTEVRAAEPIKRSIPRARAVIRRKELVSAES